MSDQTTPTPKRQGALMFVHSAVDDAGLTPIQFRVYGHFARRGEAYSSINTLARVCKIHPDTAWKAIRVLEEKGMIERQSRQGATSLFRLTSLCQWKDIPTRKQGVGSHPSNSGGGTGNEGVGVTRKQGVPPTRNEGAQSISPEVHPLKEIQTKGARPKLFISELEIKRKAIDEQLRQIENRGSFDGKPRAEDMETYKALKKKRREVMAEITGIEVNPRNTGLAGDAEERTRRVVETVRRRTEPNLEVFVAHRRSEDKEVQEHIEVPILNPEPPKDVSPAEYFKAMKEAVG